MVGVAKGSAIKAVSFEKSKRGVACAPSAAGVLALSLLPGILFAPTPARAQAGRTVTWLGRSGTAWETNGNWDSNAYPDDATTALNFITGVTNTIAILGSDHRVYGITFNYNSAKTATSFKISGNGSDSSLNVYAGGITNNTALTQTIDAAVTLRASQSFTTVSGGTLSFTPGQYNQINLQGNALTVAGAGDTLISSKIIGDAGNALVKTGAGTLTLSNIASSFGGNVSVSQGTLIAGASQTSYNPGTSVLGSTTDPNRVITVGDGTNAATLNFAASQVFGTGNSNPQPEIMINGKGGLTGSKGTLTNSNNAFNILPTLTLSGGTLSANSGQSASQQAFAFAYGTVYVNGTTTSTIESNGTNSGYHLGGSTTFDVAMTTTSSGRFDLWVSGNLVDNFAGNGAGSLVKTGAGLMLLTGTNTYTGSTTVNNGTLWIGFNSIPSSLGSGTGSVTINNGGTLEFLSSSSAGTAAITNNRGGTLNFRDGSSAGATTITNNGSLAFIGQNFRYFCDAGSAIITNNNGGTITFDEFARAQSATIINNNGATLIFKGLDTASDNRATTAGSATITNNSGGLLTFLDRASAGQATITNNSVMEFRNSSVALNATINNNTSLNFYDSSTADTATIRNNGIVSLNQHTGGLAIGDLSGSGNVLLGSNALTVGGLNRNGTMSGVLSGGGSLIKTGTGTLTLTGANTYTGGTTINAGTLVARGSALSSGAVAVASGGTLAVGQTVNFQSSPLAGGAQSLSLSSLAATAAAGNTTPFLTFNLFTGGASDTLSLTGTGTAFSFSSASGSNSQFIVGFASGSGSLLSGTTYNLITFTSPSSGGTAGFDTGNANNSFVAQGVGNLAGTTGTFQWAKNSSGNITGLQYVLTSSVVTPEPGSLPLVGLVLATGMGILATKRWRDRESGSQVEA